MPAYENFPNHVTQHFTESSDAWKVMASDGSGYDSIADLVAAGKTPYPGRSGIGALVLNCENGSAAPGSGFYFAYNKNVAPTDDTGIFVPSGFGFDTGGSFNNLWLRKTVAGDEVVCSVFY